MDGDHAAPARGRGLPASRCNSISISTLTSPNKKSRPPLTALPIFSLKGFPNPPIYNKINPADAPILTLALSSSSMPLSKVEDLTDTTLAQKISQLTGVGLVSISGGQRPAVRVQANPTALASYGLSLEDLRTVLGAANVDQAKGTLRRATSGYTIGANDQLRWRWCSWNQRRSAGCTVFLPARRWSVIL